MRLGLGVFLIDLNLILIESLTVFAKLTVIMANIEKRKDREVEEDSSGDVAVRDQSLLDGDKMTLKAFLAVLVCTAHINLTVANRV